MEMPATKEIWARMTSIPELVNAVNGICIALDSLFHPSILAVDRVQDMFRHNSHIYCQTNGKEDPEHMADVFIIRKQQQIGDIGTFGYEMNGK